MLRAASVDQGSAAVNQKCLSGLLGAAAKVTLLTEQHGEVSFRAHVALCSRPGAGAWLTAPLSSNGREMDAPLFAVAVKKSLRVPVLPADVPCPCCGSLMDSFGDHATVCACKGDRTVRHNVQRNLLHEEAQTGCSQSEREKQGLLPPRSVEDGLPACPVNRRPADVWLPQ